MNVITSYSIHYTKLYELQIERKYIKRFVDKGEEFEINLDDPLVKEIILA